MFSSQPPTDHDLRMQRSQILSSQQSGLDHLTRTLQSMAKDVDVVNEAFGLPVGRIVGGSKGTGGDVCAVGLAGSVAGR